MVHYCMRHLFVDVGACGSTHMSALACLHQRKHWSVVYSKRKQSEACGDEVQPARHSGLTSTGFCSERRLMGSNTMGLRIRFSSLQGPGACRDVSLPGKHTRGVQLQRCSLCRDGGHCHAIQWCCSGRPSLDDSLCAEGRHAGELERLHKALRVDSRPHIVAL